MLRITACLFFTLVDSLALVIPLCTHFSISFLRNWRSRGNDTDDIILQFEQTDIGHDRWPPRIAFA